MQPTTRPNNWPWTCWALLLCLMLTSCLAPETPKMIELRGGGAEFHGQANSSHASPMAGANLVYGPGLEEGGIASDCGVQYVRGRDSYDGTAVPIDRYEATTGLRYYVCGGRVRPYIGAGLSVTYMDATDAHGEHFSDYGAGAYFRAGVDVTVAKNVGLGVDYRTTYGERFSLGDERNLKMDQGFLGLSLNFGF